MTWRGPRTANDPTLSSRAWAKVKAHWRTLRLPCARCGCKIDYDGPRYWILEGRRRQNPRYFVVGHIVSRYEARRMGWLEGQYNALANTQPECQDCSNKSGARLGQKVQADLMARVARVARRVQLDESRRW